MKTHLRLNRQSGHALAKLGLAGVKPGNLAQHARARLTRRIRNGRAE
jgi:hypothetical protein